MSLDDPVVIESRLSQDIEVEGYSFEINIFRLDEESTWTLEVIDQDNASHIWDNTFASDFAALIEAQKAIWTAGAEAFMYEDPNTTLD